MLNHRPFTIAFTASAPLLAASLLTGACLAPESTTTSASVSDSTTGDATGGATEPTTAAETTADTGAETEGTTNGGMEPTTGVTGGIDPMAPDELLFQQALALYNAADFAGADPLFQQL